MRFASGFWCTRHSRPRVCRSSFRRSSARCNENSSSKHSASGTGHSRHLQWRARRADTSTVFCVKYKSFCEFFRSSLIEHESSPPLTTSTTSTHADSPPALPHQCRCMVCYPSSSSSSIACSVLMLHRRSTISGLQFILAPEYSSKMYYSRCVLLFC